MKKLFSICVLAIGLYACGNSTELEDKSAIRRILKAQQKAWSSNDLEGFMDGYWRSDSLKFYGSSGLTYGWDKTLANYIKRYPTKAHTGELNFTVNDISRIDELSYFVMGKYHLIRDVGNADGVFLIIFKKIENEWKIIADMSC
jgi:hypothetical protein